MRLTKQAERDRDRERERARGRGRPLHMFELPMTMTFFLLRPSVCPSAPSANLNSAFSMAFLTVSCLVFVSWLFA